MTLADEDVTFLGMLSDPGHIQVIERKFRNLLRQLSSLGWGLSQQKELKVNSPPFLPSLETQGGPR